MSFVVVSLIFWIPLYPRIELFRFGGVATALRFEDFVLAAVYFLWGLGQLTKREPGKGMVPKNRITLAIAVFLLAAFASTLVGSAKGTIETSHGYLFLLRYVEYFLMFFLVYSVTSSGSTHKYLSALYLTLVVAVAAAYLDGFDLTPWPFAELYRQGRYPGWAKGHVHGTFSHNYDLGAFLAMGMAFVLAPVFIRRTRRGNRMLVAAINVQDRRQNDSRAAPAVHEPPARRNRPSRFSIFGSTRHARVTAYWVFVPLTVLLILVFSRIATAAALASACIVVLLGAASGRRLRLILPVVFAAGVLFGILILAGMTIEQYIPTVTATARGFETTDSSLAWRLRLWGHTLEMFSNNVVLGGGLSAVARVLGEAGFVATATESWYVRVLAEMGLVGLASFVAFKYLVIRQLYEWYKGASTLVMRRYFGAMIGISVGLLVNAMFIDIYTSFKIILFYMLLLGLASRFAASERLR